MRVMASRQVTRSRRADLAVLLGGVALLLLGSCDRPGGSPTPAPGQSAADRQLVEAGSEAASWVTTGRTYAEERFSPLDQVNVESVGRLGIGWYQDLGMGRGQEATPLMVDGMLYTSLTWSVVRAFDARTGKPLWTFDPEVPRETLVKGCCDAVSRGVAFWNGMIFVATFDGRLIALDAKTGAKRWSVLTVDPKQSYTITGAPRVIRGKVIIGNGGGELGVRGYVTAYDAQTGKQAWRFHVVPGDPALPPEDKAMALAAKTWTGEWWKHGGGGTAWDAFAYDPKLDLLYIGTGNGSPWARKIRSPGGGDNLFLSSIVAVRPDTGEYVWHYQQTPGDAWDYTATQNMILADLTIGGRPRSVIMQAPKNGFFYVLDRKTGELISAEKFAPVNWASHVDLKTGRPVENPAARYDETGRPFVGWPSARGAHSWQPMSYNPVTRLTYIPVQETAQVWELKPGYKPMPRSWNVGSEIYSQLEAKLPPSKAYLLAWDAARGREAWRVPLATSGGGTLTTAGNLVFQGDGGSGLTAYRADTGALAWRAEIQGTAMAAPATYALDGQQYVAVMVGCGGDFADQCRLVRDGHRRPIEDRLVVFRIGGSARLPAPAPATEMRFEARPVSASPAQIAAGRRLYGRFCAMCHGDRAESYGLNPDLRASAVVPTDAYLEVVLRGALKDGGMAAFDQQLSLADAEAIRAYINVEANTAAGAKR
jgi:quinohemoprotein ethanol dehydrogenase